MRRTARLRYEGEGVEWTEGGIGGERCGSGRGKRINRRRVNAKDWGDSASFTGAGSSVKGANSST